MNPIDRPSRFSHLTVWYLAGLVFGGLSIGAWLATKLPAQAFWIWFVSLGIALLLLVVHSIIALAEKDGLNK